MLLSLVSVYWLLISVWSQGTSGCSVSVSVSVSVHLQAWSLPIPNLFSRVGNEPSHEPNVNFGWARRGVVTYILQFSTS